MALGFGAGKGLNFKQCQVEIEAVRVAGPRKKIRDRQLLSIDHAPQ
jgi:hypothetical protein